MKNLLFLGLALMLLVAYVNGDHENEKDDDGKGGDKHVGKRAAFPGDGDHGVNAPAVRGRGHGGVGYGR